MPAADRRRASRITVEVPAAVVSRSGPLVAELRDVSVNGVKLFLKAADLGLPTPSHLLEAAMAVKSILPGAFTVKLGFERDDEVERTATMARLVIPSYEPDCVELGCMFEAPLTPDELTQLCGSSPTIGSSDRRAVPRVEHAGPVSADEEAETAEEPVAVEAEVRTVETEAPADEGAPSEAYRVFVTSDGEETQLLCHAVTIDPEGLHVRAKDTAVGAADAAEAAMLFARRYGTEIIVKIMDGMKSLWSGPAEVLGMEILFDRPGDLLVTVAFRRALGADDIDRLGLQARAA